MPGKNINKGWLALSPLAFFVVAYAGVALSVGDAYSVPIAVIFLATCLYATVVVARGSVQERIAVLSSGAGSADVLLMIWVFALAGAFTATAKAMGCVNATVGVLLNILPDNALLPGLFVAACLVSFSIGTSVGTVVALVPIAAGLAQFSPVAHAVPITVAAVVGGAFFGDNLSFISDTTVVATSTQGCNMKDKFKANAMITVPVAVIVVTLYAFVPLFPDELQVPAPTSADILLVAPYLLVVLLAVVGVHVLVVLTLGVIVTGLVGGLFGSFTLLSYMESIGQGMLDMGELILVSLLAGGLLKTVEQAGGIDFVVQRLSHRLRGKRSAELAMGGLVSLVDVCTANNTIAILTVGGICKRMATVFGIDKRRSASLLDTFSCCMQGLLPYGAQVMMAAGLAALNPMEIIPHLYYTFLLIIALLLAIAFRYPRRLTDTTT